jgi:hypothetical protein
MNWKLNGNGNMELRSQGYHEGIFTVVLSDAGCATMHKRSGQNIPSGSSCHICQMNIILVGILVNVPS